MESDTPIQMSIGLGMEKTMEYTDATDVVASQIEEIRLRIPQGWGNWVSCDEGWYRIIINLDEQLNYLFPEGYEIHQIKEKYGTLRYYCVYPYGDSVRERIADNLIKQAEYLSSITCEVCGACPNGYYMPDLSDITILNTRLDGTVKARGDGWIKTLCDTCCVSG